MCLITLCPGELMPEQWFRQSARRNDDGLGVMWLENGRVAHRKMVGSVDQQWDFYKTLNLSGIRHAVHHRFGTSGSKTVQMCHPFKILDKEINGVDLYLMHNGVITGIDQPVKTASDTWHFVRDYLKPTLKRDPSLIRSKAFKAMIAKVIGGGNKFLLLDSNGIWTTINKSAGEMKEGFWLSNTYSIASYQGSYDWETDGYSYGTYYGSNSGGAGGGNYKHFGGSRAGNYHSTLKQFRDAGKEADRHPSCAVDTKTTVLGPTSSGKPLSVVEGSNGGVGFVLTSGDPEEVAKHIVAGARQQIEEADRQTAIPFTAACDLPSGPVESGGIKKN